MTGKPILTVERIVFVGLDEDGGPVPHGHTTLTRSRERLAAVAG